MEPTIHWEEAVFELTEEIIESVIFAMEDQDLESLIDLETGEVYPLEFEPLEEENKQEREGGGIEAPIWSSRDGFRLMESFLGTVRRPSARSDLSAALARGRGVFKAFKEALGNHPEVERAFRDYKKAAMGRRIREWYDELREAQGLERLGPEPEDMGDLVVSDLGIRIGSAQEFLSAFLPLLEEAESEALEYLPAVLAEYGAALIKSSLERSEWIGALIEDEEGGTLGAAAAFREDSGGQGFGRVFFIFVRREFRREGIARALLERLSVSIAAEGRSIVAIDSPLLPPSFGEALAASGFSAWGSRAYRRN